jgi:hypothetical protein
MKDLPKFIILLLVGFGLGFGFQSVLGISFRKFRNAEFVAEAQALVTGLREKTKAYHAKTGRWPQGPEEMVRLGFWSVSQPPQERLRGGAGWSSEFTGEGGFLYLSATGQVYLNADLKREKMFKADWNRVMDLVPAGKLY